MLGARGYMVISGSSMLLNISISLFIPYDCISHNIMQFSSFGSVVHFLEYETCWQMFSSFLLPFSIDGCIDLQTPLTPTFSGSPSPSTSRRRTRSSPQRRPSQSRIVRSDSIVTLVLVTELPMFVPVVCIKRAPRHAATVGNTFLISILLLTITPALLSNC